MSSEYRVDIAVTNTKVVYLLWKFKNEHEIGNRLYMMKTNDFAMNLVQTPIIELIHIRLSIPYKSWSNP